MALDNTIDIRVTAKDLASKTLRDVKKEVGGLDNSMGLSSKSASLLTGTIAGLSSAVTSFGLSLVGAGLSSMVDFFENSVQAASDLERSMITLDIIAPRFGVNAEQAKQAAKDLGKELRIGVGPAAESLQNLLKSGLSLDQSIELMRRFTNEAITGKSANISLAQAVQNLTFAYNTNNSALGNMSGVSENFADITERGRKALIAQGVAATSITDDMAKYQGMIELTNLTLGSSERLTGTLTDKQAELNLRWQEFQTQIGTYLSPIISEFLGLLLDGLDSVKPYFDDFVDWLFPELSRIIKEEIVPKVKEFVEYLKSDDFKKDLENMKETFKNIYNFAKDTVAEIGKFTSSPLFKFLVTNNIRDLNNLPRDLARTVDLIVNAPWFSKIPKYASGTNYHPGGKALVGEKGPEIVDLPAGSRVYDAQSTARMQSQNVFNFYGYDATQISSKIEQQIKLGY